MNEKLSFLDAPLTEEDFKKKLKQTRKDYRMNSKMRKGLEIDAKKEKKRIGKKKIEDESEETISAAERERTRLRRVS